MKTLLLLFVTATEIVKGSVVPNTTEKLMDFMDYGLIHVQEGKTCVDNYRYYNRFEGKAVMTSSIQVSEHGIQVNFIDGSGYWIE